MSTSGVCEKCYDKGYTVEVRKDEKSGVWDGKTVPCTSCNIGKQL